MKSPSIIYLIARSHGLRTRLLKGDSYESMIRARTLDPIIEVLTRGEYSSEISSLPVHVIDAASLNRVFKSKLSDRLFYMIKIASGKVKNFLDEYARRIEIENAKYILRAKHGGEKISLEDLAPIPKGYESLNYQAMIASKDIYEAVELLKLTPYSKVVDLLPAYRKYGTLLILEGGLEGAYYERLWKASEGLPDHKYIKEVLGFEMDMRNLTLIIGLKMRDIRPDIVEEAAFKIGYKLGREAVTLLAEARDVIEALSRTYYSWIVPAIRDAVERREYDIVKITFDKLIYNHVNKHMVRRPLSLSFVIGYLMMCEYEFKNLTAIITGKELGLSDEEIKRILII